MEIKFVVSKLDDINIILEMMGDLYALDQIPFGDVSARNALTSLIVDDSFGRIWLINFENKIIGYVILTYGYSIEYHGRDAFIDEIYIK